MNVHVPCGSKLTKETKTTSKSHPPLPPPKKKKKKKKKKHTHTQRKNEILEVHVPVLVFRKFKSIKTHSAVHFNVPKVMYVADTTSLSSCLDQLPFYISPCVYCIKTAYQDVTVFCLPCIYKSAICNGGW